MNPIEQLTAKAIKVKIDDVELELMPLLIEDIPLISRLQNKETQAAAVAEMIDITLARSYPDVPAEKRKVPLSNVEKLASAVIEVNGLSGQVDTKKLGGVQST